MAEAPPLPLEAIEALAAELGWGGIPAGPDAEGFALLLDDELERLDPAARARFAGELEERCAPALGGALLICPGCRHVGLARFAPEDGRCRACSQPLVQRRRAADRAGGGERRAPLNPLAHGGGAAALLGGEVGGEASFELLSSRALARVRLDPDNEDWDAIQDAIARAREEREQQRREAEERKRREAEERKRREEEERERLRREEEERKRREEEERKRREEEERLRREEEERQRLAELEKHRAALGCVAGPKPGEVIRIPDLPDEGPGAETALFVVGWPDAPETHLYVRGTPAAVDGKPVATGADVVVPMGSLVTIGEDAAYVVEENSEMGGLTADAIHFVRDDKQPGGPWSFWGDPIEIGASGDCAMQVVDDGVDDVHAAVEVRFGQILLTDRSSSDGADDGVYVEGKRRPWVLLQPGVTFRLGPKGPPIKVNEGEAKQRAGEKARAMKPSRHNRVVLEVRDADGDLLRKVFIFTRREVRFGNRTYSREDETRMVNELTLIPGPGEEAEIVEKQGGLALTRDAVDIRRDGGAPMSFNGDELLPGKAQPLKRRFTVEIGEPGHGIKLDGRVFRSPTSVERETGPAQLGMKGGHPFEAVLLNRENTPHTYVFLVRMLRIGSEEHAPLRVMVPGVEPGHCRILFSQGKFLIVAPKANAPVTLQKLTAAGDVVGDPVEMDAGVAFPLETDTEVALGAEAATLRFRVVDEGDFLL